jgi:hypothetical protein
MFRWDLVDLGEPELAAASHAAFDRFTELVAAAQAEGWRPGWEPRRLEILGPLLAIIIYPEGGTHDVLNRGP